MTVFSFPPSHFSLRVSKRQAGPFWPWQIAAPTCRPSRPLPVSPRGSLSPPISFECSRRGARVQSALEQNSNGPQLAATAGQRAQAEMFRLSSPSSTGCVPRRRAFISALMSRKVPCVVADLPGADPFLLHIYRRALPSRKPPHESRQKLKPTRRPRKLECWSSSAAPTQLSAQTGRHPTFSHVPRRSLATISSSRGVGF